MLDTKIRDEKASDTQKPNAPTDTQTRVKNFGGDAVNWTRRNPLIAGIAALLILGFLGYEIFGGSSTTTGKPLVVTVTKGDIEDSVTALGNLQPSQYVDVGAQVSGQLKVLHVDIGDMVKKGDLLAEIDSTVAAAKVEADKAQLNNLRAQLLDKQSTLALNSANAQRQTRLKAENANSASDYDAAQAAMRSSGAQVQAVSAQIAQSESTLKADTATLGYSKIYAPMDGTVSSITAKEGQTLNANQQAPTILQIADLDVMTVQTQVSEADVPKLKPGMDAYFTTLGVPNRRWYGKLRQIWPTPTVVNNVVLYTALFDVENPNHLLMTQMTAQVFFVIAQAHDAVTVPVSALHFATGGGRNRGANGRTGGQAPAASGTAAPSVAAPNTTTQTAQNPRGTGRGNFRRGQRQDGGVVGQARTRAATVTVVKDGGSQETRNVTVGVSDRVTAEILSGLSVGEKVVAGVEQTATPARRAGANNNQRGGQGGFGGPGGFGGAP